MIPTDVPKTPGVYKIFFLDPSFFYIGSAVDLRERYRRHRLHLRKGVHCNIHLQRAYAKYGDDALHFEIIEHVEHREDLTVREQHYLDTLKPHFNICIDARTSLGVKPSPESRAKNRKAHIGRPAWNKGVPCSPEVRDKLRTYRIGQSPSNKGISATPEVRAKLSEAHKGKPSNRKGTKLSEKEVARLIALHKGKSSWNKGVPMREETKEKQRATRTGKPSWNKGRKLGKPSPRLGVPLSPESRARMIEKQRATLEAKGEDARRLSAEKQRATKAAKKAAKQAAKQEALWDDNSTP